MNLKAELERLKKEEAKIEAQKKEKISKYDAELASVRTKMNVVAKSMKRIDDLAKAQAATLSEVGVVLNKKKRGEADGEHEE